MAEVITVSALNHYVKMLLDANDILFDIALRGEIANFVQNARSGHCYFSLRDEASSVKAVMFRADARRLAFRPEEGMRVVVRCRATLYERDGAFQLYVNDMFPDGIGAAQLALEQLKAKLEQEGLFAPEHKKPLPEFPKCIGVVTSKTGAALQDIRNVLTRRWPSVRLLLCPVTVQGFEAAQQVADAIKKLDQRKEVDEIIVARGGGSREDLWVFNAEMIARAAYRCKKPLISAIGHEIDYTILDFVADCRAPHLRLQQSWLYRIGQSRNGYCWICSKIFAKICKNVLIYAIMVWNNTTLCWSRALHAETGKKVRVSCSRCRMPSVSRCRNACILQNCSWVMRQHLLDRWIHTRCWRAATRWSQQPTALF